MSTFRKISAAIAAAALAATGAALAVPTASADPPDPLTVTIDGLAPDTLNDGTGPNVGTVQVENTSGQAVNLQSPADSFEVYTILSSGALTSPMVSNSTIVNAAGATAPNWGNVASCAVGTVCGDAAVTGTPSSFGSSYDTTQVLLRLDMNTVIGSNPAITGPLTVTVKVVEVDTGGNVVATLGSDSVTTTLADPWAPATHAPPAADHFQAYSFQLVDLGGPGASSITVYRDTGTGVIALPTATSYALNNGLVYDTATGMVTRPATPGDMTNTDPATYTIVLNNGIGGATGPSAATPHTPALVAHDVMVQFQIPVLFTDVSTTATFAGPIYRMAAVGITSGGPSGAFFPTQSVTRRAFAHFAVEYLDQVHTDLGTSFAPFGLTAPLPTGTCVANSVASSFTDVPDTAPFCTDIQQLAALRVTLGFLDGGFHPFQEISRQAMSAMMYRMDLIAQGFTNPAVIGGSVSCTLPTAFNDVDGSNPFCGQIQWMDSIGVTHGYLDGGFHPHADSTRQATMAFTDRLGDYQGLSGFGS